MTNPAVVAVEQSHQSVTEYWTRLYSEADEESRYRIGQGTDLEPQDHHVINE